MGQFATRGRNAGRRFCLATLGEGTPGEAFKLVKQFPNGDRVVVERAQLVRNHLVDYNRFLTELVENIKR